MSDLQQLDAGWSAEAQAQGILRRLIPYPEHFVRFLNFEREHLRRYREGHPHDLGPLPGWAQCLTAFRNEALLRNQGRGAAELAKRYRQSLGRIPSSGPVLRTLVPGQSDISPIPEDEMMPTYRLLAEIEAAMDAERIAARQAPAEDTPEAPFGLPPDAPKAAAGLSTRHLPRPRRTPWLSKSPSGCGRTSQRAEPRMPRLAALLRKKLMCRYPGAGRTTTVKALKSLKQ